MKLHILYEHGIDGIPHGSSYIRLLWPYEHKNNKSFVTMTSGIELDDLSSDVYIVERMWKPSISLAEAGNLIRKIRKYGKKLIYTIDDNLIDININRHGNFWPTLEQKNVVRLFARESDGIIVSTTSLKERLKKFNDNIVVVPNALNENIESYKTIHSKNSNEVVFGYMGTSSHEQDLLMIMPAVKEVLRKYNNLRFELVGVMDQEVANFYFKGLNVKVLETIGHVEYPNFMKWMGKTINWDFAIAPLEDNSFTRCKSDIKILDYGIFKIPGLYSKVSVYENTIEHGYTGLLIDNTVEEWTNSLDKMVLNSELRHEISLNVYNYVLKERTLEKCADSWTDAINKIIK